MSNLLTRNDASQRTMLFIACSIAIVMLLWLPFGFNMMGHIEEWDLLSLFTRHGVFYFVGEGGPLPTHRMRPLMLLPNAIAYQLSPNSFFAMHLLQMLALVLKGVCGGIIGWWLLRSRLYAVLLALLVVIYPADTMQLSFRSFHINWSVGLALAGVIGIVHAYESERMASRTRAILLSLLSTAMFVVATLIYELALAYAILPLLLLWCRLGLVETIRVPLRRWHVSLVWCVGVLACAAYIYYVAKHGSTYQGDVLKGQAGGIALLKDRAHVMFYTGIGRSVVGGWIDAARIIFVEYRSFWYLSAIALMAVVLLRYVREPVSTPTSGKHIGALWSLRVLFTGVVFAAVGYLPFLASPAHTSISQRTFLFATPGGALETVALVMLLSGARRTLAVLLGTVLIVLGMAAQMFQFHHYEQISDTEREVLKNVAVSLPDIANERDLLILDGSHRINSVWMLRENMMNALTYLYGKPINRVQICNQPENDWQRTDERGRTGQCAEYPDHWEFSSGATVDGPGYTSPPQSVLYRADKSTTQVVRIPENGIVPLLGARKDELSLRNDTVSRRYRAMLAPPPWLLAFDQFRHRDQEASFRWDFGRWWNLDVPAPGRGWQDAQWQPEGSAERASFSWNVVENPWLQFRLKPAGGTYLVRGKVRAIAPGIHPEQLAVSVNGHVVPLRWLNASEFYGELPSSFLKKDDNRATFLLPVDNHSYGIGMAFDWIKVAPIDSAN
ncbi:hypothetical protein XpopCFBP1817_04630 [Xanthomonas populi]|uniref:Glycosyltransferase RgtA/B/C/D-like domain-containing protein n=1 Tax=Xanthomonas populi TaxID=53414 RepID=A0A2S7EXC8_9XANT|nr:hypothetical protein [Xanthomonas populi]PPU97820.1 hypothetical protein XpopCFBP1817_04630 [Xanthomonas populi]